MPDRVTSTRQQVKASQNALKQHPWPKLASRSSARTRQMYSALQESRPHDDWPNGDLIALAGLARLMVLHAQQLDLIEKEGTTVLGGRKGNTVIAHPSLRIASELLTQINATSRRLGLTSMTVSEKRSRAARNDQERDARSVLGDAPDQYDGRSLM